MERPAIQWERVLSSQDTELTVTPKLPGPSLFILPSSKLSLSFPLYCCFCIYDNHLSKYLKARSDTELQRKFKKLGNFPVSLKTNLENSVNFASTSLSKQSRPPLNGVHELQDQKKGQLVNLRRNDANQECDELANGVPS